MISNIDGDECLNQQISAAYKKWAELKDMLTDRQSGCHVGIRTPRYSIMCENICKHLYTVSTTETCSKPRSTYPCLGSGLKYCIGAPKLDMLVSHDQEMHAR